MAHIANESVFCALDHESRLGELLWRRVDRAGRRLAAVEPREQRRAAQRDLQIPGRPQVRPESAHARDTAVGRVPAEQRSGWRQPRGYAQLLALLPEAADGRGVA